MLGWGFFTVELIVAIFHNILKTCLSLVLYVSVSTRDNLNIFIISPWYSWKIVRLALTSNYSFTTNYKKYTILNSNDELVFMLLDLQFYMYVL